MMPDELPGYQGKSREELIALVIHRDQQIDGWRVAWKWEQDRRLALEKAIGNVRCDPEP